MTTIHSPLRVEILMHCHVSGEMVPLLRTPQGDKELEDLIRMKAIESDSVGGINGGLYRTTPLGNAWVKAILNTPIPRVAYLDQHGKEIE